MIRNLTIADLEQSSKLYTTVFNHPPWSDGWEEADATKRLSEIIHHPHYLGIGAFNQYEELVGFVMGYTEQWLNERHFFLNEMCVDTHLQGSGIGTTLLASLEEQCKSKGIKRIYLLTASGSQAEQFYRKNNFYVSEKMMMMAKKL